MNRAGGSSGWYERDTSVMSQEIQQKDIVAVFKLLQGIREYEDEYE